MKGGGFALFVTLPVLRGVSKTNTDNNLDKGEAVFQ